MTTAVSTDPATPLESAPVTDVTVTDTPGDTPPIVEPLWHEHSRTITVQAYKVGDNGDRVITINGLQDVGPGNYVVNEGGFITIVDAAEFEDTYPDAAEPTAPTK